MPHIIIEHTKLVSEKIDIKQFNKDIHNCLSNQETVSLESIKTRSIELDNTLVGNGSNNNFVHITILLLQGRSSELKAKMADNIYKQAKSSLENIDCLISVNIDELGVYKK